MKKLISIIKKTLFYTPGLGRGYLAAHWIVNLAFLALWCWGIGVAGLYLGKVNYGQELFWSYFDNPLLLRLNLLPGFLVAALLLFTFGGVWPAVLGSGAVVLGVGIGNHYKMLLRDDPLMMVDLGNLKEAAQISTGYSITISPVVIIVLAAAVLGLAAAIFLMRAKLRRPAVRIAGALLVIALGVWLVKDWYLSDEVYEKTNNIGVEFASTRSLNRWSDTDKYCCRGFIYPFINSAGDIVNLKPEGYTRREAEAALEEYGEADIAEGEKVNIISIMLEAYCDLSLYEGVSGGFVDAYDFFHRLQQESVSGSLLTNIFAGGTIDTERCYITGSTRMYEYRASADSFARYFAEQGYRTEFCHPGYAWFYNRRNVMEYLGFERSHFHEDRYSTTNEHSGDGVLFPDIISLYEESKAAGEPYFNFSVTYQNHGPYPTTYFNDPTQVFLSQGGLSREAYCVLTNYLEGISRTDRELEKMVEYFRAEDEPVVLVLFGDHKPWLGDASFVYAELGIDLSLSTKESFYNYYATPYVIWANDAAKEALGSGFVGDGGDMSPCFLMMKLFDLAGWQGDGYTQALRELYAQMEVASSTGLYMIDGRTTSYIEGEAQAALDKVKKLEYYRMKDFD